MKKIFMGLVFLVFGVVWYLRDTGAISLEPFWPIVAIIVGLLLILKAFMMSPQPKKRR